jgi:V/A-type H+-transporting ATPase subunit E
VSLSAIIAAIQASGDSQVRKIETVFLTQRNEILAEAHSQAEQVKAEARSIAIEPAYRELARSHQRGRLQSLQIVGNARKEFVDTVFDQLQKRLAMEREQDHYPKILWQLVEEAIRELKKSLSNNEVIQIEADPRDREVMESIFSQMGLDFPVNYVLNSWGGLIAKSEDNRIVVINTLETRLERATTYLQRYLAAIFESDEYKT